MKIKTALRVHLIPVRILRPIKQWPTEAGGGCGEAELHSLLVEMQTGVATLKISVENPTKLKVKQPYDPFL